MLTFLILISLVVLLVIIYITNKKAIRTNRIKTVAKIYGVWFLALIVCLLLALVFHIAFANYIIDIFNLSDPDTHMSIVVLEICSAVVLSLVVTYFVTKRTSII